MNSLVAKGLDIRKFGGCNATALLCNGYGSKDPLVTHSLQNILDFAETVILCPQSFHMILEQVWPEPRDELEVPHRWSKVKRTYLGSHSHIMGSWLRANFPYGLDRSAGLVLAHRLPPPELCGSAQGSSHLPCSAQCVG